MEGVLKLYVRKRTSFENVGDSYQNNSIPVYQIRFHHSLVLFREALQTLGATVVIASGKTFFCSMSSFVMGFTLPGRKPSKRKYV